MSGLPVTVCILRDGEEITVDGTLYRGSSGNLSGLPEDCYPAEPSDMDVTSAKFTDSGEVTALTDEELEDAISKAESYFEAVWNDPPDDRD